MADDFDYYQCRQDLQHCQLELEERNRQYWEVKEQNEKLLAFLKTQEAWEAAVLNGDSPWFDQMPDDFMDLFEEVQRHRNQAK